MGLKSERLLYVEISNKFVAIWWKTKYSYFDNERNAIKLRLYCTFFSDCDYVFKIGYMGVNGNIHTVHFSEINRMLYDCVSAIKKKTQCERAFIPNRIEY